MSEEDFDELFLELKNNLEENQSCIFIKKCIIPISKYQFRLLVKLGKRYIESLAEQDDYINRLKISFDIQKLV